MGCLGLVAPVRGESFKRLHCHHWWKGELYIQKIIKRWPWANESVACRLVLWDVYGNSVRSGRLKRDGLMVDTLHQFGVMGTFSPLSVEDTLVEDIHGNYIECSH